MRIYKKPKIPKITCRECGCVFKPCVSDLKRDKDYADKLFAACPACETKKYVHLDKLNCVPRCSNCYFWSEKTKHCYNLGVHMQHDDFCSCFLPVRVTDGKRFEDYNPPREANDENTCIKE